MDVDLADPVLRVRAFGVSRQGAAHRLATPTTPCQDAFVIVNGAAFGHAYLLAAVADGHGATAHDRSGIGAQLAVNAAALAMQELMQSNDPNHPAALVRAFKSDYPRIATRRWREAVCQHAGEQGEAASMVPDRRRRCYSRYGSTLLVMVTVARVLLLGRLGDGDLVLFRRSGAIEEPLADNDDLVGGETFSLCSEDADKLWQVATVIPAGGDFVSLSTDGLSNAYAERSAFYRLLAAVRDTIETHGVDGATAMLPDYLDHFSAKGSGDDITLVGLLIGAAHAPEQADKVTESEDRDDAPRGIARTDSDRPGTGAERQTPGSTAQRPLWG